VGPLRNAGLTCPNMQYLPGSVDPRVDGLNLLENVAEASVMYPDPGALPTETAALHA
jgi:hypothetical protein